VHRTSAPFQFTAYSPDPAVCTCHSRSKTLAGHLSAGRPLLLLGAEGAHRLGALLREVAPVAMVGAGEAGLHMAVCWTTVYVVVGGGVGGGVGGVVGGVGGVVVRSEVVLVVVEVVAVVVVVVAVVVVVVAVVAVPHSITNSQSWCCTCLKNLLPL